MKSPGYYGSASHMTADLKRHAHEVRRRVDALPCPVDHRGQAIKSQPPRRKRLVVLSSEPPIVYVAPRLSPRDRHRLAWGGRS